jgi:hypothetical protein
MNPWIGWALAATGTTLGYLNYGWQGVALALSVVLFWLLLQFTRAAHVLRVAGRSPKGKVPSAVVLHSKLRTGLQMIELLKLTRSLGDKLADNPETWRWRDDSGAAVQIELSKGRLARWELLRDLNE